MAWCSIIVDSPGNVGGCTSIALDRKGRLHLVYYDVSKGALRYARREGFSWQFETVDTLSNFAFHLPASFSLAVDGGDVPHISYYSATKKGLVTQGQLKYAIKVGTTWNRETVDDGANGQVAVGWSNSIAVDRNNVPHISYVSQHNQDSAGVLRYARKVVGAGWSTEPVVAELVVGRSTCIAVDSLNIPHISYFDTVQPAVKYATRVGTTWNRDTVASKPGGGGWWNAIAMDAGNVPHLAYFNPVTKRVEYARKEGAAWNNDTVADAGDLSSPVGMSISIAVDSAKVPHISYYSVAAKDLKYARKEGTNWNNDTVDAAGNVGTWTDIALDDEGMPFISYYHEGKKALKCARVF